MNPVYIGAGAAACIAAIWYLLPYGYRLLGERRLRRLCRAGRTIVLTYDDGPGENLTPKVLELLRELGVRATFFMLGSRIAGLEPLSNRVLGEGHEAGSHSEIHLNAWKSMPTSVHADILRGARRLAEIGGDSSLFRPPFGKLTLATWIAGLARGYRLSWWTIDTRDSLENRASADEVIEMIKRNGGGVVLMHDYDGYRTPNHEDHVLDLTRRIVELSRAGGYNLMTVGQLLAQGQKEELKP